MCMYFTQSISRWQVVAGVILIALALFWLKLFANNTDVNYPTTSVSTQDVRETVSVSGFVEADNTAALSFPTIGIVTDVMVQKGAVVEKGDVLATLGSRTLVAQRNEAVAAYSKAEAAYNELLAGPTTASRNETAQTLDSAEVSYRQTLALENEKVENARIALLSNDLTAYAEDADTRAAAPTVSGSYTCSEDGSYTITTYRSGSFSGYSYRFSGLESGVDAAYTQQTAPLGDCGLTIQFAENADYGNSTWVIPVPNTNSASYTTYKNAHELAQETRNTNVAAAEAALALAKASALRANEGPTSYEAKQARSTMNQAAASIAAIDAQITEKSIIAPFDGVITDVDILPGETAGSEPIITLLAEDAFSLTARVPEIDITKVTPEQAVEIVFDAQSDITLTGLIDFVSPLATEIDGVAYFETTITLDENPNWVRSGLNADIEIIIQEQSDTSAVPVRFIAEKDSNTPFVVRDDAEQTQIPITVEFIGNEGYAAIDGLASGTVLRLPETQ